MDRLRDSFQSAAHIAGFPRIEMLEMRRLLCGLPGHDDDGADDVGTFPVLPPPPPQLTARPGGTVGPTVSLSDVPRLSSRPSAPASIYLDFVGDNTPDWG